MSGVTIRPELYKALPVAPNAAGFVCRVLSLPNELRVLAAVGDVLSALTIPAVWEDVGGMSPLDMTALIAEAIAGWHGMIGSIVPMITSQAPPYGLLCDGSSHARADYPLLYDALDPTYIVDSDSFQVPDLRGRTVIGAGQGIGLTDRPVNSSGGQEQVQLTQAEMPSHVHNFPRPQTGVVTAGVGAPVPVAVPPPIPAQTGPTGGDQPHENMPPFVVLNYFVVAR